jgi:hypothetical protein
MSKQQVKKIKGWRILTVFCQFAKYLMKFNCEMPNSFAFHERAAEKTGTLGYAIVFGCAIMQTVIFRTDCLTCTRRSTAIPSRHGKMAPLSRNL